MKSNKCSKTAKCNSSKAKACTKTTCNKTNPSGFGDKLTVGDVRWIKVASKKAYFVSDLVNAYGRGFVDRLPKAPAKMRIKHNNNSQQRRIVCAASLKGLLKLK